ncbi:MAG: tetratricopeptide repeat protein, partial [Desulfobacteraceae bacterium]|nr:tetratricopeptide repeat protein [Desulfobacteraceae bacterium]
FAEAHNNRGNALKELDQPKRALESYDKAIQLKPNFVEAYNNRGNVLNALGQPERALESFDKTIQCEPDFAEAYINRGNVLNELGQPEQALENYDTAIQLKPDNAKVYNNRGNALRNLEQFEKAVESFEKALRLKPDFEEAYNNRANVILSMVNDHIFDITRNYGQRHRMDANLLISENKRGHTIKINLLYCPFVDPITPPLGIASLKAFVENENTQVNCMDLNLEWYLQLERQNQNSTESIRKGKKLFKNVDETLFDFDRDNRIASNFVDCIHGAHLSSQYLLCKEDHSQRDNIFTAMKTSALKGNPDVVGFSILFDEQILCSLLLAEKIKKVHPEVIVVFGGAAISCFGEKIQQSPFVDFVVYEAGEEPFKALLESIRTGRLNEKISGVAYKKTGECIKKEAVPANLEHNFYPDFSDYDLQNYFCKDVVIPILSSKGCYWRQCSFCVEGKINQYSEVSVDRVVDEIEHHFSNGFRYFQFVDEMISPKRLRMISKAILSRNLKVFFYATLRPSADFNNETLELMYDAGFRYVIWGVESYNRRVLKLVNKGTTLRSIRNTLKESANAGIRNHIFVIIGFPSETPEELFDTMQFIYDNRDYIHQVHPGCFTLSEGTEIFKNPKKFDIEIEFDELKRKFTPKHKQGYSGRNAKRYMNYYHKSLFTKISLIPSFAFLRDHALLRYAKIPLDDDLKLRKKVPQPILYRSS